MKYNQRGVLFFIFTLLSPLVHMSFQHQPYFRFKQKEDFEGGKNP